MVADTRRRTSLALSHTRSPETASMSLLRRTYHSETTSPLASRRRIRQIFRLRQGGLLPPPLWQRSFYRRYATFRPLADSRSSGYIVRDYAHSSRARRTPTADIWAETRFRDIVFHAELSAALSLGGAIARSFPHSHTPLPPSPSLPFRARGRGGERADRLSTASACAYTRASGILFFVLIVAWGQIARATLKRNVYARSSHSPICDRSLSLTR